MSRYDWLLFLHLIGAFAAIGSAAVFTVLFAGGDRVAGPQLTFLGQRLFDVGGVLTIVFGVWLALDDYNITDGWIIGALVLWIVMAGAGSRVGASYREGQGGAAVRPLFGVMALATLAILYLMIFKPGA